MINRLLIQERIGLINSYLSELSRLSAVPKETFLNDKDKAAAAESYLRRALEAVFDIGRHILAKSGGIEMASEYKAIARGLGQKNILSKEMSGTLIKMAGYRNRLVHLYNLVTEEELYSILKNNLEDFRAFCKEINNYISLINKADQLSLDAGGH